MSEHAARTSHCGDNYIRGEGREFHIQETNYLEGKATRRLPSFYRLLGSSPATVTTFFLTSDRE